MLLHEDGPHCRLTRVCDEVELAIEVRQHQYWLGDEAVPERFVRLYTLSPVRVDVFPELGHRRIVGTDLVPDRAKFAKPRDPITEVVGQPQETSDVSGRFGHRHLLEGCGFSWVGLAASAGHHMP